MKIYIKYNLIYVFFCLSRIYIPSGVWAFNVSIWNCSFTLHNIRDFCIENMSLKGRSLPISNHSHSKNPTSLTTYASHTFVESSPYEDSYYYLSIVSNSIIKFNIKVDVTGNLEILACSIYN